jgi:hypothetical protein
VGVGQALQRRASNATSRSTNSAPWHGWNAHCEQVLLEDGSRQEDIWGADWLPFSQEVQFEALINIRPRQNNPSMTILDPAIRARVETIAHRLLEGVMPE